MSDAPHLLPPNATPQERALSVATARMGAVPVPITALWNPDTCPSDHLAFLAWAFGVDEWDAGWSEEAKRNTIREAVTVQSRKGTVWSVRRALMNAGYGAAQLIEGDYTRLHNGATEYDGSGAYADPFKWAMYSCVLERSISNAQAAQVRRLLNLTAPARCQLVALDFTLAANIYNGAARYDGAYNHGTA
jgi:phage tail P2-like protein